MLYSQARKEHLSISQMVTFFAKQNKSPDYRWKLQTTNKKLIRWVGDAFEIVCGSITKIYIQNNHQTIYR